MQRHEKQSCRACSKRNSLLGQSVSYGLRVDRVLEKVTRRVAIHEHVWPQGAYSPEFPEVSRTIKMEIYFSNDEFFYKKTWSASGPKTGRG